MGLHNVYDFKRNFPEYKPEPILLHGSTRRADVRAGDDTCEAAPIRDKHAKRVAFRPSKRDQRGNSPGSAVDDELLTDLECERHCYSERCGLPPLVTAPSPSESFTRSKDGGDPQVWRSREPHRPAQRSTLKPIDQASAIFDDRKNRVQRLLLERKESVCGDSTIDGLSTRSSCFDTTTSAYTHPARSRSCNSPPNFLPRFQTNNRSFLNPDPDHKASQGIDPGVRIYQQTRDMLEQARQCLANPESDYLDHDLEEEESDTLIEPFEFPTEGTTRLSQAGRRLKTSDDISHYLERKARYAQAIKLNYKGKQ